MYVCSTALKKELIVQSVLVVQDQLFLQSPLRVKSAKTKGKKANCTKKIKKRNTHAKCTNHIDWNKFQNSTCTKQLYKAKIEKCCMYCSNFKNKLHKQTWAFVLEDVRSQLFRVLNSYSKFVQNVDLVLLVHFTI